MSVTIFLTVWQSHFQLRVRGSAVLAQKMVSPIHMMAIASFASAYLKGKLLLNKTQQVSILHLYNSCMV